MEQISRRLAALAAFVPAGSSVADIGTDHAYLPVYLVKTDVCRRVIATDVREGPFGSAKVKVQEHGLDGRIELRLGDGLQALEPGEAEVLVLAGMGGNTIREILTGAPQVLKQCTRLILQPMADAGDLRIWLAGRGWKIWDERLVEEDGRIYVILAAVPGEESTKDKLYLELGPRLIEKKDPLLAVYLERITNKYEKILASLAASKSKPAQAKKTVITEKLTRMRELADACKVQ
ncbi:MAG: tRNA (adenine(22)-N(1))-methyltransferase [Firmicutes bacterium ADurb.Bin456]|nr:MAG: tRNA (adenine(22)-N(1))-methyltransferase [Firmicutes bacterium ADurb.Bin456]